MLLLSDLLGLPWPQDEPPFSVSQRSRSKPEGLEVQPRLKLLVIEIRAVWVSPGRTKLQHLGSM